MNKLCFRNHLALIIGIFLLFGVTNLSGQSKFSGSMSKLKVFGDPTIATDRTAYKSGETIVIVGSGYGRFEQVNLVIGSYNAQLKSDVTLSQWSVYADYKGQFRTAINFDSLSAGSGSFNIRAFGTEGKTVSETVFSGLLGIAADLDQCRNGTSGTDQCTGGNWQNGNLGSSNSNYLEGEFVPYRMLISGAAGDGATVHTLVIEYDTSQNGKHALDYIGTYNANETDADPCDYAGCPFSGPKTTNGTVPIDPLVTNGPDGNPGGGDDITQIPGVVTIWGGEIQSVTLGAFNGTFGGNSMREIIITFTSDVGVTNPVLAWGGHISTRLDWGIGNSAASLPGSPYHMRLISIDGGGGNQDMSMSTDAILYPAFVRIVKDAIPNAPTDFTFTATGPGVTSPFTLDDDAGAPGEDNTYSRMIAFNNVQSFGAGNEITVTEDSVSGWMLTNIKCLEEDGGLGATADSTTSVGTRSATIRTQEAEIITCTFTNQVILAAPVSVQGRVTGSGGRGLSNVLVRITDIANGVTHTTYSNSFGRYVFNDLEVGGTYQVAVTSKRYLFNPNTRIITLNDNVGGLDFITDSD